MVMSIKEKNERSRAYRLKWQKKKSKEKHRNEYGFTKREEKKITNLVYILLLLDKGIKQKDISKELGITQQYISKLKNEYHSNIDIKMRREIIKRCKKLKKELG